MNALPAMTDTEDRPRLVEIPGNPAPEGLVVGTLKTSDGRRLRHAVSNLPNRSRGTVLILQGRNESIEKYFETISDLNRRGFSVATFDWRGQGGSERLIRRRSLGHVRHFGQYLLDLECILQDVVLPDCRGPYVVLGHSMGGLIALHGATRLANSIECMVLCAPLLGFVRERPGLKTVHRLARLASWTGFGRSPIRRAIPGKIPNPADNPLTSDGERFERNRRLAQAAPDLFLGSPTVSWLAAVTGAMRRLESSREIARLSVPTLFVTAGGDRVVSTQAIERLAWRMRCGSSVTIPLARHELLQEADRFREQALEAFDAYVAGSLPVAA